MLIEERRVPRVFRRKSVIAIGLMAAFVWFLVRFLPLRVLAPPTPVMDSADGGRSLKRNTRPASQERRPIRYREAVLPYGSRTGGLGAVQQNQELIAPVT